ncbi:hypothetical protein bplSymb_SCF00802P005 [Bathymodiolus platifrons methanotrophic gill symbiont]|uniref:hypothetical protein n=1 Tax=Bathymodiolus platifrons methanotrophic gill symbiont TaxID=113268 RepID=UPI000B41FB6E|nr:hypothetical protein [Bathymodiolus platifrons methanotrophic gill symbiont]TXK93118.1 hypothetical protein BMR10_16605 [Methylococcaceae bacterium CS4]TXK93488.1 hypothetical protein BMR11_16830 [Methylococcaceae bacterium CS5]TXL03457.1 hypothetical protein BMR08_17165 [Methylococcaceae bacterium CS2]GAW85500.1 hypothetical protein bplSymb_SCF00802P005 [Bathymodiolus platifrons methanotrophic gill symbiont]GFO77412.1 hypothetical protein BPLS_P5846 [Bathymodiolus platifrons methanotrophic
MRNSKLNTKYWVACIFAATAFFSHISISDTTKNKTELKIIKSNVSEIKNIITGISYPDQDDETEVRFRWRCKDSDYPKVGACVDDFKVGDKGPAGGIVYYTTNNGEHGLEVSLVDLGFSSWGCSGTSVLGARGAKVGDGKANTDAILAAGCASETSAAYLAAHYKINGISGWHLPSKDSLDFIYIAFIQIWGISADPDGNNFYWSSTEDNAHYAFTRTLSHSYKESDNKGDFFGSLVLPVRPF